MVSSTLGSAVKSSRTHGVGASVLDAQGQTLSVGDWVQAVCKIPFDEGFVSAGDVGHVVHLADSIYPSVFFERVGQVTLVELSEVKLLGNAETGRAKW